MRDVHSLRFMGDHVPALQIDNLLATTTSCSTNMGSLAAVLLPDLIPEQARPSPVFYKRQHRHEQACDRGHSTRARPESRCDHSNANLVKLIALAALSLAVASVCGR